MIPRRYAWLLRDEGTCFEQIGPYGGGCKLCAALERPDANGRLIPFVLHRNQSRHLAAHRAEKITAEDTEAATVAAATERGTL